METTSESAAVIDWQRLDALRDIQPAGEPDIVLQIIAMFDAESSARVIRARAALAAHDAQALREAAHSLRGSAGLIGADALRAAATAVEREAERGDLNAASSLVEAMAAACTDVQSALAQAGVSHGGLAATAEAPMPAAAEMLTVLLADDDGTTLAVLSRMLAPLNVRIATAGDGDQAWARLQTENPPDIVIADWMMPGVDGPELCRRIRGSELLACTYVILLTSRDARADVLAGLRAGADDYVLKPCDDEELRARVQTGMRIVGLERVLSKRVAELQAALAEVKRLSGLLPICAYCKRIRVDGNYWEQVERYIAENSDVQFSHGICPSCMDKATRDLG